MIAFIGLVALLEVWGVDAIVWFYGGQIGSRLLSAVVTIGIAALAAAAIWEISNALMDRQINALSRDGHYARAARLRTFQPMLRTALLCLIVTVVGLTALSEIGVNVAPLLAGAGIVGIAIGFGSQKLVQDLITGLFLLLENTVQVGDNVSVSGLSGDGRECLDPHHSSARRRRRGAHRAFQRGDDASPIQAAAPAMRPSASTSPTRKTPTAPARYSRTSSPRCAASRNSARDPRRSRIVGHRQGGWLRWRRSSARSAAPTAGRWPVQREFNRRMKRRFQECGIEIASAGQTILMQIPAPADDAPNTMPRRAAG